MIEYVLMDYNGEPATIEGGEILFWETEEGKRWNPATREFEDNDTDDTDKQYWLELMRKALAANSHFHPRDLCKNSRVYTL